jgi:hypothetical protein
MGIFGNSKVDTNLEELELEDFNKVGTIVSEGSRTDILRFPVKNSQQAFIGYGKIHNGGTDTRKLFIGELRDSGNNIIEGTFSVGAQSPNFKDYGIPYSTFRHRSAVENSKTPIHMGFANDNGRRVGVGEKKFLVIQFKRPKGTTNKTIDWDKSTIRMPIDFSEI